MSKWYAEEIAEFFVNKEHMKEVAEFSSTDANRASVEDELFFRFNEDVAQNYQRFCKDVFIKS